MTMHMPETRSEARESGAEKVRRLVDRTRLVIASPRLGPGVQTGSTGTERESVLSLIRHIGIYVLASLIPASIFLFNITGFFVADDWPLIARNVNVWQDGLQPFMLTRFGWYRPIFDLFIFLCWKSFGLNPAGYHLYVFLLYVSVSIVMGLLAELLTADRQVGVLSTFLFALHGSHAEPVLWIASANEVVAGLFVVLSMAAYVLFRRSSKAFWLLLAWVSYVLGLASKETATFLPLALVIYDVWLVRRPKRRPFWRVLIPTIPFVVTGTAFAIFRLWTGSPYSTSVGILRVVVNLVYYVAVEVLALPDNYGYLTSLPLWRSEPLIPLLTVGLAASAIAILGWLLLRSRDGRGDRRYSRVLIFTIAWSFASLLPVIFTATGRTAFLSSMGVAWTFAILFVAVWREAQHWQLRRWALLALALLVSAHLAVSAYRVYWWRQAGETSKEVMAQVRNLLSEEQIDSTVWLIGLPDHLKHAYAFRNAFPEAAKLLFPGRDIRAMLDVDLQGVTRQQAMKQGAGQIPCVGCAILWYQDGALEELR